MNLVEQIRKWQQRAREIVPPDNKIERAIGELEGRAFFPEGLGLQRLVRSTEDSQPDILVVGHNFGTLDYRKKLAEKFGGSEDNKPTWRNLKSLLGDVMDRCFMTNWFIGFGSNQTGKFLPNHTCNSGCSPSETKCSIRKYEEECLNLIINQIRVLKPKAVLLLGEEVIRRAHKIAPDNDRLKSWHRIKASRFFSEVDKIGALASNVDVPEEDFTTNFVALIQPSFHMQNHAHRAPEALRVKLTQARKECQTAGRQAEIDLIRKSLE